MTDTQSERARFEAWALGEFSIGYAMDDETLLTRSGDGYADAEVNGAWRGMLYARRAALSAESTDDAQWIATASELASKRSAFSFASKAWIAADDAFRVHLRTRPAQAPEGSAVVQSPPQAQPNPLCGLSWDGKRIEGDRASVEAVKTALHEADLVPQFRAIIADERRQAAQPVSPTQAQPMRWHELKTDPEPFDAVASGAKTHEIRRDDRNFKVGDGLLLRRTRYTGAQMHMRPEHCPLEYTGETERRVVTHIQTGYGLSDGWAILSIATAQPVSPPQAGRVQEPASSLSAKSDAYDTIDRYLRNNLYDTDYAAYSTLLDMVYATPQSPQEPRKPLTEAQIKSIRLDWTNDSLDTKVNFVRAVEAAHGIVDTKGGAV